jgi:hypothetical protein
MQAREGTYQIDQLLSIQHQEVQAMRYSQVDHTVMPIETL